MNPQITAFEAAASAVRLLGYVSHFKAKVRTPHFRFKPNRLYAASRTFCNVSQFFLLYSRRKPSKRRPVIKRVRLILESSRQRQGFVCADLTTAMVGMRGLEPPDYRFLGGCLCQFGYTPIVGGDDRIRTYPEVLLRHLSPSAGLHPHKKRGMRAVRFEPTTLNPIMVRSTLSVLVIIYHL